jgi:hypothetical protein
MNRFIVSKKVQFVVNINDNLSRESAVIFFWQTSAIIIC